MRVMLRAFYQQRCFTPWWSAQEGPNFQKLFADNVGPPFKWIMNTWFFSTRHYIWMIWEWNVSLCALKFNQSKNLSHVVGQTKSPLMKNSRLDYCGLHFCMFSAQFEKKNLTHLHGRASALLTKSIFVIKQTPPAHIFLAVFRANNNKFESLEHYVGMRLKTRPIPSSIPLLLLSFIVSWCAASGMIFPQFEKRRSCSSHWEWKNIPCRLAFSMSCAKWARLRQDAPFGIPEGSPLFYTGWWGNG